jgi:uncharacterized protein (DUF488 family)
MSPATTVFTIGHSTRPIGEFVALLKEVEADELVDVRAFPRSRSNPQFNHDALAKSLQAEQIEYRHLAALGGRRPGRRQATPSPNTFWEHSAFRNYADYAMTSGFRAGFEELLTLACSHRCAIMCAEAVWWRCHRRIIADYLIVAGLCVMHILDSHKVVPATLTPAAVRSADGTLAYPLSETDRKP